MKARPPTLTLVVDTDIAKAASTKEEPRASASRAVLDTMLAVCHRLALSHEQESEWITHASGYTLTWMKAMQGKGKWVTVTGPLPVEIQAAIDSIGSDTEREEVVKDEHLLAMALNADGCIVSMDDKACQRMGVYLAAFDEVQRVGWFNPEASEHRVIDWLESRAPVPEEAHLRRRARSLIDMAAAAQAAAQAEAEEERHRDRARRAREARRQNRPNR